VSHSCLTFIGVLERHYSPIIDWMFGISFYSFCDSDSGWTSFPAIDHIVAGMYPAQVRICCPSVTFTTFSCGGIDLELVHSAIYICIFLHCHRIASTARPSASCIRPSPDTRQPHRRAVACDVVGPQGGWNPILSCWYGTCLVRRMVQ
jgi:hypothetical protein